jgi:hypothetical protein
VSELFVGLGLLVNNIIFRKFLETSLRGSPEKEILELTTRYRFKSSIEYRVPDKFS